MKVLLDECVPQSLCRSFTEHECKGARRAGFGGKKNGQLLQLAEEAGFQVLVTVDKNIPYQQNLRGRSIALLIIDIKSNRAKDLRLHARACIEAFGSIRPGQVVKIGA